MWRVIWFFLRALSLLPMPILYLKSDITYFLLYYVIRYRRKVVRENLEHSFKQMTKQEILKIEKQFFHNFCDSFFESIKIADMSSDEILRRMEFVNSESLIKHYEEDKSVLICTSHNGNWEWMTAFSLLLPKDKPLYHIYKAQKGETTNKIILNLRSHFGGKNIEMRQLLRQMVTLKNAGNLGMFGLIGDQSPVRSSIHYYTDFLGQHTAVISGTERLAKKFDYPVYYASVKKVKRGYYTCELISLAIHPREKEDFEITEQYMRLLEKDILEDPSTWLWSHRRWKLTRK